MRKLIPFLLVALLPPMCRAQETHRHGVNSINTSESDNDSCEGQIRMSSDEYPHTAYAEESKSLPNQPLTVTASKNGGIRVRNWDKNEFAIKVCKAATGDSDAQAQQLLSQITLNAVNGVVTINGPGRDNSGDYDGPSWAASLIILAPVGSTMDLSAHNGGISLKHVNANVTGHTVNGGISLNQTSGKADLEARNGGISIKDCGGDVKATVQNGGISIKLGGDWQGGNLVASTHNGGVIVEVPKDFRSSLEIANTGHGSIRCESSACDSMQRTWNDNEDRVLRIGGSPAVVRATTVNGGIVVRERTISRDAL
jgi:putative adhesin